MPEVISPEVPIKNIDILKNTHQKLTPQMVEELKELLKNKYGIDLNKDQLHITLEELNQLKAELDGNINPKTTLEKFLYDEYIETKLQNEGRKAVSLETITSGIESGRLSEMKAQFEAAIEPVLNSYDFLNESSKNTIKLALANKFLNSNGGNDAMSVIGDLKSSFENISIDSLSDLADKTKEKEKGNDSLESQFKKELKPYIEGLNTIQKKLNDVVPKLTAEEKQNIINATSYFRNPASIEAGWNEKVSEEIDLKNKNLPEKALSAEEQKNIKEYLLASRTKVEVIATQFEGGEKVLEMGLDMMSKEGFIGDTSKSIVEFLLKIPILGQILALFLGLNGKDPLGDLNEQVENYKLLKSFRKLGVSKDNEGKISEKGVGIFKEVDLSQVEYSKVKPELKEISAIKGAMSPDDFWKEAFEQKGVEIEGVSFKLKLTDEMKKDNKITTGEFKEIIQSGIKKFHEEKEKVEVKKQEEASTQKRKQQEQKIAEVQVSIQNIDGKIGKIDDILSKKYETIVNFTTLFGAAISDVTLEKIRHNSGDNFQAVIKDTIGDLKYKALLQKDPEVLNTLFGFIQQYAMEKNIESGNVKDFLQKYNNDFQAFLMGKKEILITQKETNNENLTQAQEHAKETSFINQMKDLLQQVSGKNLNDIAGFHFSTSTGEIKIADTSYKLTTLESGVTLTNIIIEEKKVVFEGTKAGFPGKKVISKQEFINGVETLLTTGKYKNDHIALTKIA